MMDLFWENAAGELEVISFDATLREEHTATATVTQYPVEGGADAADHVVPSVVKKMFECFVSDSPSEVPLSHMFGVRGTLESVTLDGGTRKRMTRGATPTSAAEYEDEAIKVTAQVLKFDGPFARRERVFEELERLRKERVLLTSITTLDTVENVVISALSFSLDSKEGEGVTFRLELTQITFAETQIVDVPDPEQPRARRPRDAGATTTSEASPEQESLLYQWSGL